MDFHEQMQQMLPDTIVHTVSFDHQDGTIEIAYADLRDQTEGLGMAKTIMFERELFNTEVNELERDLTNLIDEVVVSIRNEDARKARIDSAMARLNPPKDDDDDDDA